MHKKFEMKVDTNYYLMDKSIRQRAETVECTSEDGPNCPFLNQKSLVDSVNLNNSVYMQVKQGAIGDTLRSFAATV